MNYSAPLYLLTRLYFENRTFKVRRGNFFSSIIPILAGVPYGSYLSSDLYNIFTSDIPQTQNTIQATYADDTFIYQHTATILDNPLIVYSKMNAE